ncbi:hypothetical protein KEM55_001391, partial [Ascosphaera atra]
YNGTSPNGGDSMSQNLNIWYDVSTVSDFHASTEHFFYSGLARRKSALSLIWLSLMSVGVVSFQWFFWGYSLTFSHTASSYIGNLDNFGFKGVLAQPSVGGSTVPDLLFALFQGMFACIT